MPAPAQPVPPSPAQGQAQYQPQSQGGLLGGLGALLEKFQQNGHGGLMDSWIGPGQNQPIAPDQLHRALGPETVDSLSRQSGLNQQDLLSQLSQYLPGIIDKMTPNGRLPTQAETVHWTDSRS